MDGYELLKMLKAARSKYEKEIDLLKTNFITSNINFRIGSIVEFKNHAQSGVMIVDKIWLKHEYDCDLEEINRPQNFIITVR